MPRRLRRLRPLTPLHRFQWRVATLLFALGAVYGFATGDPLVGGIAVAFTVFALLWVRLSGSVERR